MKFSFEITGTKTSTVFSGTSAWEFLNSQVEKLEENSSQVFILVDDNTERFCLPLLLAGLPALKPPEILKVSHGEQSKTPETAFSLWNGLTAGDATRESLLINLGGGVVTDLGGFVAATYKRGIPFINVPTTLMAMADAGVGGKTAINLQLTKNTVGTFSLPEATCILPVFLKTLDNSDIFSGLAEIFKIALVADAAFWEYLNSPRLASLLSSPFDSLFWEELITKSAGIKCKIVERDFLDKGERAILNFGHTIGHALESLSYQANHVPASHGWAVSVGVICESHLSMELCGLKESDFLQISQLIFSSFAPYPLTNEDIPMLLRFMEQDKKKSHNGLNFTLLESPGVAVTKQIVEERAIIDSLEYYCQVSTKR